MPNSQPAQHRDSSLQLCVLHPKTSHEQSPKNRIEDRWAFVHLAIIYVSHRKCKFSGYQTYHEDIRAKGCGVGEGGVEGCHDNAGNVCILHDCLFIVSVRQKVEPLSMLMGIDKHFWDSHFWDMPCQSWLPVKYQGFCSLCHIHRLYD